jgi:hypothetical protein
MHSRFGGCRLTILLAALVSGLLYTASSASASDTFTLINAAPNNAFLIDATVDNLQGVSGSCFGGVWGNPPNLPNLPPVQGNNTEATLLLANDGGDCQPNRMQLGDPSVNGSTQSGGNWYFEPDDPFLGSASINCPADSTFVRSWKITTDQDDLSCTFTTLSSDTPDINFVSTAAAVRHGEAFVAVQEFGRSGTRGFPFPRRIKVVLRNRKGRVVGRRQEAISVGLPRPIRVPLAHSVRRRMREKKVHQVTVTATITAPGGKPATGDHGKTLILQRYHQGMLF